MMTDRQLENLLRMAHEADEFARADQPALRLVNGGAPRTARPIWRSALAWGSMAAVLGLAVGVWMLRPAPTSGPALAVNRPAAPATLSDPAASATVSAAWEAGWSKIESMFGLSLPRQGSVVMAIVQDQAGGIRCVRWTEHEWSEGRNLDQVDSAELKALAKTLVCERDAPRVVVVGLEGPAPTLPQSESMATEVAECILRSPTCHPATWSPTSCAQQACMPEAVRVRFETLAMR